MKPKTQKQIELGVRHGRRPGEGELTIAAARISEGCNSGIQISGGINGSARQTSEAMPISMAEAPSWQI